MIRVARRTSLDFENILYATGEVAEIPWEANYFNHAKGLHLIRYLALAFWLNCFRQVHDSSLHLLSWV
jgi:hypothetical protein